MCTATHVVLYKNLEHNQSYHVDHTNIDPETNHRLEDNVGKGRVDIRCRGKSGLDLVERIEMQQYYARVHRPIARSKNHLSTLETQKTFGMLPLSKSPSLQSQNYSNNGRDCMCHPRCLTGNPLSFEDLGTGDFLL